MDTIAIPSPSTFLRTSLLPPLPTGNPKKVAKKKLTCSGPEKPPSSGGDGVLKPKQSKSRNGCVTCKAKRLKCDETKPTCLQCHKRNVECGGYKKDFKWRSFEETSFTGKPAPLKTQKSAVAVEAKPELAESPNLSDASRSTIIPPSSQMIQDSYMQFSVENNSPAQPQESYLSATTSTCDINVNDFDGVMPIIPDDKECDMGPSMYPQPIFTMDPVFGRTGIIQTSNTAGSSFSSGQSPRLIDLLLPGTDLNSPPPNYMEVRPQRSEMPYQPGAYTPIPEEAYPVDDDVEEIAGQPGTAAEAWVMRLPSPAPSTSSSSSSADSLRFDQMHCVYSQPRLHAGSPEMLMLGFDTQTCGILSVKDGPTENPWRTHVWPLARDSPALYHAISSMAAFHSAKLKPSMKVEGMEHMRRSIRYLAGGIENMRTDTALATTLVLAFSESWDIHVSTGIEHLRGAKVLVDQAMTKHRQNRMNGEELVRLRFLYNTWIYMDVIARLTNIDEDDSSTLNVSLWAPLEPFGTSTEVDPLMGCASTLFPLIGRVANLVRRVRKSDSNSINIISQANELKTHLEMWDPPTFFEPPEDPTSDIQDSLQTAEAYRWATLLYLHQAVPEIPSLSAAQLAKKVLIYLATVPPGSRAIIVQIYPLLAAGCEASTLEDRAWVEDRWNMMSRRMLIGNVDRCLEVVKEVWRRRDADEATRLQQRNQRLASRMTSCLNSSVSSMKRAFSAEEQSEGAFFDWPEGYQAIKRRATEGEFGMPMPVRVHRGHKSTSDSFENTTFDETVRGRLHWAGVMRDWNWEVLLG
ncbi:hypothetical protein MMC13_004868 [Lambiella insularis]|nr:hypothetical protein [Lambiella insularis]